MSDCEIVLVRGVDDANGHLCGGMSIAECCDCGASLWAAMWDCRPGRRNSGQSEPQPHISKEGDPSLRTLLVQGAHHILGPFGADSDPRRLGLKLAERGGKNGKKRAVIATARKLAVLLHRLWVSGEAYEPLRNSRPVRLPAAA